MNETNSDVWSQIFNALYNCTRNRLYMGTVLSHLHILDMLLKLYSVTTWTDVK